MADYNKLSKQGIQDALDELTGWSLEDGMFHKTFEFKDFNEAVGWMMRVALAAEKLNHHPDWCNSWNKVEVHLLTHAVDALSEHDVKLARKMNELAA